MADIQKDIFFNVFQNNSDNPKAPTHSFNNFEFKEEIVIPKGTVADITFWGNATKDGKPNPHMRIGKPYKSKQQKAPF